MIIECKVGMKKEYKQGFFPFFYDINFHNFLISRISRNYLELFNFPKITRGQPEFPEFRVITWKVETLVVV